MTDNASHQTDWLFKSAWGVMFHYVSGSRYMNVASPRQWNEIVDTFDADALAGQLADVGAGYLLLTVAQWPPLNGPSVVFERFARVERPACTRRDLLADVAEALDKKRLTLMAYVTYGTPAAVKEPQGDEPRVPTWWTDTMEELSLRWGKSVRGWWIDGNEGNEAINGRIARACRAGNAEALLAFNKPHGFQRNSIYENYTAGDTPYPPEARCQGRWADKDLQWHMLSFLGFNWGPSLSRPNNPRYDTQTVVDLTANLLRSGGIVTWDVPPLTNGLIDPVYLEQLAAIGEEVAGSR
ncbi:MAG: hypothetical protein LLG01_11585 [Planctomycetaceae bacterium]|nr:hypothetical protein [Planctomycetaceae bacterium]